MQDWLHEDLTFEEICAKYGPWSAMSIQLPDGSFTRTEAIDYRLKRLVQITTDLCNKPLAECRVLDLACLEGHYGIEFAMHGAQVVCVEIREENLAKTSFSVNKLGLKNCRVVQDDVRNLNKAQYGEFDIIICSGILYHLEAEDAATLIYKMSDCCKRLCIIDTYVAVRETGFADINGKRHVGFIYKEHNKNSSAKEKLSDLWASVDNTTSFWFSPNSLAELCANAGFTSCSETLLPTHPGLTFDRRNIIAIKGVPTKTLSSPITNKIDFVDPGMPDSSDLHSHQTDHGIAFKIGKKLIPQPIKDIIKPTLRKIGILKTHPEPFQTKQ